MPTIAGEQALTGAGRRIASIFKQTTHWRTYDIFARQKMDTFKSSRPAVLELAARYRDIVTELQQKHTIKGAQTQQELEAAEEILFREMCEICLWGNATDLSLLTNLSYEDIQKLQGSEARKSSEKNILVNDLDAAFRTLSAGQKSGKKTRRVDIVLDNAGFELFVDLILAGYLIASGLATEVVFHPKSIPWFVSDVVPADFASLLSALAQPQAFYSAVSDEDKASGKAAAPLNAQELDALTFLFTHWTSIYAEGQLVLRPNDFWTQAGSYWRLPRGAPDLFADLQSSELVIFKGDLNYRKLTADVRNPAPPLSGASLVLPHVIRRTANAFGIGCMGPHHALHPRHRAHGPRLRRPRPRAADMQGRRRRRAAGGQGRGAEGYGGREYRGGRAQVGMEREVGCCAVLRRQGVNLMCGRGAGEALQRNR